MLQGSVLAGAQFESSRQGTLVYANQFTRDAIHECGEAILGFRHEVFLGKNMQVKGVHAFDLKAIQIFSMHARVSKYK